MDFTYGANSFATGRQGTVEHRMEWQEFIDQLLTWRDIPRQPSDWTKRSSTPWITPYVLGDLGHRRRDNLAMMTDWIGLDIDDGVTIDWLNAKLDGVRRIFYTTSNSRSDFNRWRVILGLDRYHTPDEHEAIWRWANVLLDRAIDPKTKDATRLHYVPAMWHRADNQFVAYDGLALPVDDVVAEAPPAPVEPCPEINIADLKAAPDGDPIITDRMIAREMGKPVGGRLFNLMKAAARRYLYNGWTLTDAELEMAAMSASQRISPGKRRPNLRHEAGNAIRYAERHTTIPSPLAKYRDRLTFSLSHCKG